ncbi:uncharacterized protein LOC110189934 isoform X1 [Drosophila serrata]|uniref:uncharacterized protein LOC110189934 isoform X1 n=1 Tax=Drosophila serrata TaxID=7274 RepID=UPI000A1D34B9|nr:uncharacterized protein LOC110189934 isoform X1 [Drosophila serrata]
MKRKYFVWTPEATKCFLDVWETNLKSFRGKRKKTLIQKDMAEGMSDFGVTRIEIKAKLQVMTKRYRNEALEFSKTGVRPKWEYFSRLRNIFEREDDDFGEVLEVTENADNIIDISDHESSSSEFEFPEPACKIFRRDLDTNVEENDHIHYYYRRPIDVEEEKLAIQKETLHVMRSMAKNLSNMYATSLDFL